MIPAAPDAWSVIPVSGALALRRCEESWRDILAYAPTERLFLQPEWVEPWLEILDHPPRALFAAQHGVPRAASILVLDRPAPSPAAPRVLRPPGLGVSDYLDLLLPPEQGAAEEALSAMLEWLSRAAGWDLLDLPNLPSESATVDLVWKVARRRALRASRRETYARPFIALEGSWESYLASRPNKLRYNLRARRRRLAELGEVIYGHYTSPDDVKQHLQDAFAVHARRWQGQHTSTTFSASPEARRFYLEAVGRMAAIGRIDFSTLELEGRLLAFCLSFVEGKKLYYYLPAFDPDYSRFGPSTDLLAHLIEKAYLEGFEELDLLLGDEPYKLQWATGSRKTTRVVIAAPGPRGSLALAAFDGYLHLRERARGSPLVQRARRYGPRSLVWSALRRGERPAAH